MNWWENRMCAFDLETTAPEPKDALIVQAAVALVGGGLETDAMTVLVDPGVEIPAEATEVHGITNEMVRADGQPAGVAIPAVLEALRAAVRRGYALVAFNARYDFTALDRAARRLGLAPLDVKTLRCVDPLVIDRHLDRYRKSRPPGAPEDFPSSRTLAGMCAHYGAILDTAHDAASDAVSAARLAWVLGAKGKVIRRVRNGQEALELDQLEQHWESVRYDLDKLHAAQVPWAAYQAAHLEEWFASQGEDVAAMSFDREWPVVPFTSAELCDCGMPHLGGTEHADECPASTSATLAAMGFNA